MVVTLEKIKEMNIPVGGVIKVDTVEGRFVDIPDEYTGYFVGCYSRLNAPRKYQVIISSSKSSANKIHEEYNTNPSIVEKGTKIELENITEIKIKK